MKSKIPVDVLWFAPFAGINSHAEFEASFIQSLERGGYEVYTLRCDSVFRSWCTVMSSQDSRDENFSSSRKNLICKECKSNRTKLAKYNSKYVGNIDAFLESKDYEKAALILKNLSKQNWSEFEHESIPFGKYWSYEVAVEFKTNDVTSSLKSWNRYRELALSGMLSYLSAKKSIKHIEPKIVLTHSFEYAINRSFLAAYQELGIPCYSVVTAGPLGQNHNRYFRTHSAESFKFMIEDTRFPVSMKHPLSSQEIDLVLQHLLQFNSGNSVFSYSPRFQGMPELQLRGKLNLPNTRNTVLVIGSSPDEIQAAELALLSKKSEKMLTDYEMIDVIIECAKIMPKINFVYRFHPRLVANHRDSRISSHFLRLKNILENAPENVSGNLPEQNIGILDLAQIVDCCITVRSTAALQLMSLGCPVIFIDPQQNPFDLSSIKKVFNFRDAVSRIERFISSSIDAGWKVENAIQAFRYFASTTIRMCPPTGLGITGINPNPNEEIHVKSKLLFLIKLIYTSIRIPRKIRKFIRRFVVNSYQVNVLAYKLPTQIKDIAPQFNLNNSNKFNSVSTLKIDSILSLFRFWESWLSIPKSTMFYEKDRIIEVVNGARKSLGLREI